MVGPVGFYFAEFHGSSDRGLKVVGGVAFCGRPAENALAMGWKERALRMSLGTRNGRPRVTEIEQRASRTLP